MFVAGSAILKNPRNKDAYAETIKVVLDSTNYVLDKYYFEVTTY